MTRHEATDIVGVRDGRKRKSCVLTTARDEVPLA